MSKLITILRSVKTNLRHSYWGHRLGLLGSQADIQSGVHFEYPERIKIGDQCRISRHALLRANTETETAIRLGSGVSVKENTLINTNQGEVVIGDDCWLGPYSLIYGNGGVVIGNHVMIASHCVINTVSHHADRIDIPMSKQGIHSAPVIIEDDVWIGIGAVILQGIRLGQGCIVGAGAVVTRDVEPGTVVAGIPARAIRQRGEDVLPVNGQSKTVTQAMRKDTHVIKYS